MPKVIGLTGGIATGKSTVSELLIAYGFKIVDADIASREAVKKGSKGLEQIKKTFGGEAIDDNGEMNRKYMGELVFNHPEKRIVLNNIVHPIVRELMEEQKKYYLNQGFNVVMDIPLLFENDLQIQIDRLMERNNLTQEDAKARVLSQISIDKKSRMADYVIDNLGDKLELKQNLQQLLEKQGYISSINE